MAKGRTVGHDCPSLRFAMPIDLNFTLDVITWEAVSALSGLMIAGVGFVISRNLRRHDRHTQRYALLGEYRREVTAFSKEYFEIVADVLAVRDSVEDPAQVRAELERLATRLSGMVDAGRFLFPNDTSGDNAFGFEKGDAFAGRRRPALDAILAAYHAVKAMKTEGDYRQEKLAEALAQLRKIGVWLSEPIRANDPVYLLIQSRRCYLNAVVPETQPDEWRRMFSDILAPVPRATK